MDPAAGYDFGGCGEFLIGAPWVRLEVEAGAEGKSIRVVPRALHLLDRRVSLLRIRGGQDEPDT